MHTTFVNVFTHPARVAMLGALCAAVAACGGGGNSDPVPTPGPAPAPSPAPAPAPAPATRTPAAATPLPASNGARHEESVQRRPSGIHLAHVRLQKQAVEVLEQLYGKSAEAKVVDLAGKHDPITEPIPFLNDCEQLASMLVGAGRAHELFMPLRNSLDA